MRKANKILMATVAILLCLVLITTSVASGIFAKFVITKSGEATITFERFGVTVTMSVPSTPTNKSFTSVRDIPGVEVSTETFSSTGHTITISGLKMRPGLEFPKAVKFAFTGEPNVPVQVKITPTITYDSKVHTTTYATDDAGNVTATYYNYYVPDNAIVQSIANDGTITYMPATYFMPLGFNFSYDTPELDKNLVLSPWMSSTNKDDVSGSKISNAIANGIVPGNNTRLRASSAEPPKGKAEISVSGNTITIGTFAAGTEIQFHINGKSNCPFFHMGFYYPLDSSTDKEKYDKISTYIAEHIDPNCTITVSYTVELVQT